MRRMTGMVGVAWSIAALFGTACGENVKPVVAPELPRSAPEVVPVSFMNADWNYYTGQQALYAEGGYAGFDRPDAYRSTVFTVQRTLQPDYTWSTVILVDQRLPFGPIPTDAMYGYDIARIETNDAHSYFRIYDRSGALIDNSVSDMSADVVSQGNQQIIPPGAAPMPTWPSYSETVTNPPPPPPCPNQQIICPQEPLHVSAGVTAVEPKPDPRAWIDAVIVTEKARVRIAENLERSLGRKSGKVRALDRYMKTEGRVQMEVLVDPKRGTILEENQAVDGELRSHATYEYQQIEPGVLLRSASHIEIAPARAGDKPRVIHSVLSNVKVGRIATGGGQ